MATLLLLGLLGLLLLALLPSGVATSLLIDPPTCAIVLLARSGPAEAVRAFCATSQVATCEGHMATTLEHGRGAMVSRACDVIDHDMYLQRAIYFAASRDANGHRQGPGHQPSGVNMTVLLSRGKHVIRVAQPCWYPFGAWTALHIPSGVLVRGSSTSPSEDMTGSSSSAIVLDETCVKRADTTACIDTTTPLDNIILISDYRVGAGNMSTDEVLRPAIGAGVESLAVSGFGELAVNGIALQGIDLSVTSSTVTNVTAGISGGYFTQFIAVNSSEAADPACNLDGWCEARRLRLQQSAVTDCTVRSRLQGITIIGDDCAVSRNSITLSEKTWTSGSSAFGIGMGVSAGFVGSRGNRITDNDIAGGDYSVGTDGSFPLLMSVPLFVNHWQSILEHYPAFATRYPAGCAKDNKLIFQGNDFVLASQVLLDMASHYHALSSQESVYDAGFNSDLTITNNTMRGAVCAVSLYRTRNSRISNNVISSAVGALAMYGVELGMSHNISMDDNHVSGSWHAGVIAQGAAIDDPHGCGPCQAHLGASFNTLTRNEVIGCANGIVLGFGMRAGAGNVVRGNSVSDCQNPCNFSNALQTQAAGNSPDLCNRVELPDARKTDDDVALMNSVPRQCGGATERGRNIGDGSIWEGTVVDAAACCAKCTSLAKCRVWEFEPGGTSTLASPDRNCWVKDNVNKNETGHRISGVLPGRQPHPPTPGGSSTQLTVKVNGSACLRTLDPMFLSFNIDANLFPALNFSRPQLIALASELQPAMIRLGGGAADLQAYFHKLPASAGTKISEFNIMSMEYWRSILHFANSSRLQLLFDLNACTRNASLIRDGKTGPWQTENTEELLDWLVKQRAADPHLASVTAWQLGNEPGIWSHFHHVQGLITGETLAGDFKRLRALLDARPVLGQKIYGPDVCCWKDDEMETFLEHVADGLDALVGHQYAQVSTNAEYLAPDKTTIPAALSKWQGWLDSARRKVPVILGETAGHNGNGRHGFTDTFISGFYWLELLGTTAQRRNVAHIFRQELVGHSYALVGAVENYTEGTALTPTPDYFSSVLWKRLIGTAVLSTTINASSDAHIGGTERFQAWGFCGKQSNTAVIAWTNAMAAVVNVTLDVRANERAAYIMTAKSNLNSMVAELNGVALTLTSSGALPKLKPVVVAHEGPMALPPHSYGFVELRGTILSACSVEPSATINARSTGRTEGRAK